MNDVINANRKNKYAGANLKRKTQDKICAYIYSAAKDGELQPTTEPCIIKMNFVEANHKRDVDNVQSSQKFILDAMVNMQVIPDDSPKYVKQIYHEISYSNEYECKVEIMEADGGQFKLEESN